MKEHVFKENIVDLSNKLKGIIDKLKLRSHLANMEAKQSYEELTKSMLKLEADIRHLSYEFQKEKDQTNLTFHLGLMEARQRWGEILEYLRPLTRQKTQMEAFLDHARIQAHLANMESKQAYDNRKEKLISAYKNRIAPSFESLFKSFKKDFEEIDKHLSQ